MGQAQCSWQLSMVIIIITALQDLFEMGLVPSDTDYRMFSYATLGKWPGIDVAFILDSATYHTSRDKLHRLQQGACQVRHRQAVEVQCAHAPRQRLWAALLSCSEKHPPAVYMHACHIALHAEGGLPKGAMHRRMLRCLHASSTAGGSISSTGYVHHAHLPETVPSDGASTQPASRLDSVLSNRRDGAGQSGCSACRRGLCRPGRRHRQHV